jgi:glycine oxidase
MKPLTIVVGAGMIGSAIAYELSKRGHSVSLMESLAEGGLTSSASAGMINPYSLAHENPTIVSAGIESLKIYPGWASSLQEETGIDIEWRACGSLRIALSESEERSLHESLPIIQASAPQARIVAGEEACRMEPLITDECRSALWLPDEGQVNSSRLLHALRAAAARYGVEFHLGQPVVCLEIEGERVIGVHTPNGMMRADWVVIAAGAWTGTLLSTIGLDVPILPVRGQSLLLADTPKPLNHLVISLLNYFVPRRDGTIVLGATVEHVGFDMRPTAEGFALLLSTLKPTLPGLLPASFAGYTVGLRPGTPDGSPVIGFASGWKNLLIASGHGRHGILLAPITARRIAGLITDTSLDSPGF